ncbi:unnamed protein product [Ranitomeya imitator]|uniref:Uncharacterized protein n=1 Tax=Ranitomeya imitator TaxID=111125 RepID=A0ABN9LWI2_9NEOB|nr:unnamed protein product [Ranitomeya imitator]
MKNPQSCQSSSLSVYDGTPDESALLGDLCRTNKRDFSSTTNSISIVIKLVNREGFYFFATYLSIFTSNQNVK